MTKDEFREFVRETISTYERGYGQYDTINDAIVDKITDQWEDDITEAWQRGVEVGRESAS